VPRIGPYEAFECLGQGGFGSVYRGRGPEGRDVAIKVLHRSDPQVLARFEREQRLHAQLGSEAGFVPYIGSGVHQGTHFLVMDYLRGGTLRTRLEKGPLPRSDAVELVLALARTVTRAHDLGIVHRDLKPENVLFTEEGRPRIGDLGLAKHFATDAPGASQSVSLSVEGAHLGTPGYLAPEQLDSSAEVGPAADVFALGGILYECLAGQPAFTGSNVLELLAKIADGRIERIPDLPPWLEAIVEKALARSPGARFADARALSLALARGEKGEKRAPRGLVIAALALAGLGATGAALALRPTTPSSPTTPISPTTSPAPPPALVGTTDRPRKTAEALAACERAERAFDRSDPAGARAEIDRARSLDPTLARPWSLEALDRLTVGDQDRAAASSARALELDPDDVLAWLVRARLDELRGGEGMEAATARALGTDPRDAKGWFTRGWERFRMGDAAGALADAARALDLDPRSVRALVLHDVSLANVKIDDAGSDVEKAIELSPSDTAAWTVRGYIKHRRGDAAGAIADYTRAIELEPRNVNALRQRAAIRAMRDPALACDDAARAIELNPDYGPAWLVLARTRDALGQVDEALTGYKRFVELAPQDTNAAFARQRIQALGDSRR
jgi:tetratricopeptide (TPR) repeat protein